MNNKNSMKATPSTSSTKEEDPAHSHVHLEGLPQPSLKAISEDVKVHLMANAKRVMIVVIVMFILSLIAFSGWW